MKNHLHFHCSQHEGSDDAHKVIERAQQRDLSHYLWKGVEWVEDPREEEKRRDEEGEIEVHLVNAMTFKAGDIFKILFVLLHPYHA